MILKFREELNDSPKKQGCFAACLQSDIQRELQHFPAQPELCPLGSGSGVNSTSNVAFHWNGFSSAAHGAEPNTVSVLLNFSSQPT